MRPIPRRRSDGFGETSPARGPWVDSTSGMIGRSFTSWSYRKIGPHIAKMSSAHWFRVVSRSSQLSPPTDRPRAAGYRSSVTLLSPWDGLGGRPSRSKLLAKSGTLLRGVRSSRSSTRCCEGWQGDGKRAHGLKGCFTPCGPAADRYRLGVPRSKVSADARQLPLRSWYQGRRRAAFADYARDGETPRELQACANRVILEDLEQKVIALRALPAEPSEPPRPAKSVRARTPISPVRDFSRTRAETRTFYRSKRDWTATSRFSVLDVNSRRPSGCPARKGCSRPAARPFIDVPARSR